MIQRGRSYRAVREDGRNKIKISASKKINPGTVKKCWWSQKMYTVKKKIIFLFFKISHILGVFIKRNVTIFVSRQNILARRT